MSVEEGMRRSSTTSMPITQPSSVRSTPVTPSACFVVYPAICRKAASAALRAVRADRCRPANSRSSSTTSRWPACGASGSFRRARRGPTSGCSSPAALRTARLSAILGQPSSLSAALPAAAARPSRRCVKPVTASSSARAACSSGICPDSSRRWISSSSRRTVAGSRSCLSASSWITRPRRSTACSGSSGSRNGSVSRPTSAPCFPAAADEVPGRHRAADAQLNSPVPVLTQLVGRVLQLARLVRVHEERGVGGVELVRGFPDGAGDDVALHGGQQRLRIVGALGRDGVVDDLAEADPRVPGGVGIAAADLLRQLCRLTVVREDLLQDGLLHVAAPDQVLHPSLELTQRLGEL